MASYNYSSGTGAPTFTLPVQTVNGGLQSGPPPPAYQAPLVVGQSNKGSSFNKKNTTWLSVLLIISGVLGIIGGAIGLRVFAYFSELGMGFWCGLMFIATGAVAIAAGHAVTIPLLKATVATTSIAVAAAFSQLVTASIGVAIDSDYYSGCLDLCYNYPYRPYDQYCACDLDEWEALAKTSNGLLISSASLAFVFGIWLLVIASKILRSSTSPLLQVAYILPQQTNMATPQIQPAMVANPQIQPIILLSNNQLQPTVLMNNQMSTPFVMQGIQQAQPAFVFTQQPQASVTVNMQTQPTVSSNSDNYERLNLPHPPPADGQTDREEKEED